MGNIVSVQAMLEVVASFDAHGRASPSLIAWELFADEHDILTAWNSLSPKGGSPPPDGTWPTTNSCTGSPSPAGSLPVRPRTRVRTRSRRRVRRGLPGRVPVAAYEHNRRPPHRRADSTWAGRLPRRPAPGLGAGATGLTSWFARRRQRPLAVGFEFHDAPQLPQPREVLVSVKRGGHSREIAD